MDIRKLTKDELLLLAEELGVEVSQKMRKPEIRCAIQEVDFEEDEIAEAWEKICRIEKERAEARERKEQREQRQAELELEREQRKIELELERIRLEQARLASGASVAAASSDHVKMTSLLQPFSVGNDIGLYLVNFERMCERHSFTRDTWPQRLLALLPGEASQVVARLSAGEAGDYDLVKSSLLSKYKLSTEEFRRRFRTGRKKANESFVEFACSLTDNLVEWIKGSSAEGDFGKLQNLICLEQFYECLPDNIRLWVRDRQVGVCVKKAGQLADEYVTSRGFKETNLSSQGYRKAHPGQQPYYKGPRDMREREGKGQLNSSQPTASVNKEQEVRGKGARESVRGIGKETANHLLHLQRSGSLCQKLPKRKACIRDHNKQ